MNRELPRGFRIDRVPFIPGYDLLERERNRLSQEEAAAVGMTLFLSLQHSRGARRPWSKRAALEAMENRL